jgi:hypothetical protein
MTVTAKVRLATAALAFTFLVTPAAAVSAVPPPSVAVDASPGRVEASATTVAAPASPAPDVGFWRRAAAAPTLHPAVRYPSDCFLSVVSWSQDYAKGTCGYVPPGASFVVLVSCRDSSHTYSLAGFRQWSAYHYSTAGPCPNPAEMVKAWISLTPST